MDLAANKRFYMDLLNSTTFPGHGVRVEVPGQQDAAVLNYGSIEDCIEMGERAFQFDCQCAEKVGDDRVPVAHAWSGTDVFAAAFGSPVHRSENDMPFALPAVSTAEEADDLVEPDIHTGPLGDILTLADGLVERFGSECPVRICDVQSPFDVAALIWEKTAFYVALLDTPDAVHRLLEKVTATMVRFVRTFRDRYENACLVHYPNLWIPAEWGVCLSEDEAGSVSASQFEEFCMPYLSRLAETFGGISLHSCAHSQHQWDSFLQLPGLRYLNLHHPPTSLEVAIEKCSGKAVLVPGDKNGHEDYLDFVKECLALAQPDTRFFFIPEAKSTEEARDLANDIKALCGR